MLDRIKENLRIDGNNQDAELIALEGQGRYVLNGLLGVQVDYVTDLDAQRLLLDYVRLAYHDADELFEENYHRQILRLQMMYGAKEAIRNDTGTETEVSAG